MKRISFAFVAAAALLVNACEKHPSAETQSALHTSHDEGHVEGKGTAEKGEVHGGANPHSPTGVVPTNPAGSGPTDQHDPALDKGGGNKEPGAVKYFPNEGKK